MSVSLPTLSPAFRKRAVYSVLSIVLFVVVYVLLLIGSLAIVYYGALFAFHMVVNVRHWITILLGLGIVASSLLLVYFMVKFLFQRTEAGEATDLEVRREEEPELFALIDGILAQLDVKRPKKVFLTHDVNASVVYNSTFWSMFFPVRKNLRIGLGLLNSLHREELRAVIAHEFGHFSQRSMTIGSYAYQANYIIFNLLNNDERFMATANTMAGSSAYVYPFVWIAMQVVRFTQWTLGKLYALINLNYFSLSREMEYHADAVAAALGGGPALATGLRRMDLASRTWNDTLHFVAGRLERGQRVDNLYPLHDFALDYAARRDTLARLPVSDLPVVDREHGSRYLTGKVTFGNQYASHPETEDRIEHLALATEPAPSSEPLAMTLLVDPPARQRQLTERLLRTAPPAETEVVSAKDLVPDYLNELREGTPPPIFNGYFDHHPPDPGIVAQVQRERSAQVSGADFSAGPSSVTSVPDVHGSPEPPPAAELFTSEWAASAKELAVLQNDLEVLDALAAGQVEAKTFDYDGQKYRKGDLPALLNRLKGEEKVLEQRVETHDRQILNGACYHAAARGREQDLLDEYEGYGKTQERYRAIGADTVRLRQATEFMTENLPLEEIGMYLRDFKPVRREFEATCRELLTDVTFAAVLVPSGRATIQQFLTEKRALFIYDSYDERGVELFFTALAYVEAGLGDVSRACARALLRTLAEQYASAPAAR